MLIECVATLADNFRSTIGAPPGVARPAALLFLDASRNYGGSFCTINEFMACPFVEGPNGLFHASAYAVAARVADATAFACK